MSTGARTLDTSIIIIMYNPCYSDSHTQEHKESCKFKKVPCPNKPYGCYKLLLQSQLDAHLEKECRFIPVECPWCSKRVHNKEVSFQRFLHVGVLLRLLV